MSKWHRLTGEVDEETLADLDRLAARFGRTREHLVTTAVMRFVSEELAVLPLDENDPLAKIPPYEDRTPEGKALTEAARRHAEALAAFIKVGEDDIEKGNMVSQDEMERWFAERVAA